MNSNFEHFLRGSFDEVNINFLFICNILISEILHQVFFDFFWFMHGCHLFYLNISHLWSALLIIIGMCWSGLLFKHFTYPLICCFLINKWNPSHRFDLASLGDYLFITSVNSLKPVIYGMRLNLWLCLRLCKYCCANLKFPLRIKL